MPICDGCGFPADNEHIRRRIQRLALATRYRPVHISVLLIDAAPPGNPEDFFYAAGTQDGPQVMRNAYFRELSRLTDATGSSSPESVLAEFQRRGLFLTYAVECPVSSNVFEAVRRLVPTTVRRVQTSYKPKYVALLSPATAELVQPLHAAGWGDRLILNGEAPFSRPADASGSSFGDQLALAISKLP